VSRSVADNLIQLGEWEPHLHDLGEHLVKKRRIHLFNLCKDGLGCPDWPSKLAAPLTSAPPATKSRRAVDLATAVSYEWREECEAVLSQFDEVSDPHQLREFTKTNKLALVHKCIPHSAALNLDELFNKLIVTGRWETLSDA